MSQENLLPKITVLMAVYNGEKYLRPTMESVLNQTFKDFEFLIINDGSTDGSEEIILAYSDPRIRLVNNESNLGLPKSLNIGLKISQGEFIARQDADDVSEPERLEKQISFLERNSEIGLVGAWYKEIDESGNFIKNVELPCGTKNIYWDVLFYTPLLHTMFRKELVLSKAGFYNESYRYAEDWELYSRIATKGIPVANVGEYLISYRIHPKSMSSNSEDLGSIQHNLHIRTDNFGHLLKWDLSGNIDDYERRTENMVLLFFQEVKDMDGDLIDSTIADMIDLSEAYVQKFKLTDEEKKSHLIRLYYKFANANAEKRRVRETILYLNKICGLDGSLLFRKKTAWIFIKLILPLGAMRRMKRYCELKLAFLPSSIRSKFSKTLKDLEKI